MQRKMIIAGILVLLVAIGAGRTIAEGTGKAPAAFVDLDGDGFSDEAVDGNNNGIPDEIEAPVDSAAAAPVDPKGGIFAGMPASDARVAPVETNAEAFGRLQFSVRVLTSDRSGMECGFSEAGSASSSNSAGGGCPGGVCLR